LKDAKRDIDKIATELTELMYDFKDHRDKAVRDALQTAAQIEMEIMTSKVESHDIYVKLDQLFKSVGQNDQLFKEKFQKFMDEHSSMLNEEELKKQKEK
jgi:hypothetical protein